MSTYSPMTNEEYDRGTQDVSISTGVNSVTLDTMPYDCWIVIRIDTTKFFEAEKIYLRYGAAGFNIHNILTIYGGANGEDISEGLSFDVGPNLFKFIYAPAGTLLRYKNETGGFTPNQDIWWSIYRRN